MCWRPIGVFFNRRCSAEASAAQDASLHPEQTVRLPPAVPGEVWEPAAAADQCRLPPHGEIVPSATTTSSASVGLRNTCVQPFCRIPWTVRKVCGLEQISDLPLCDVTRGTRFHLGFAIQTRYLLCPPLYVWVFRDLKSFFICMWRDKWSGLSLGLAIFKWKAVASSMQNVQKYFASRMRKGWKKRKKMKIIVLKGGD